jgi:orotidine-5'-phosphate decarboxylase
MTQECCLLVNSSRAIIYADSTENFAKAAAEAAKAVQLEMATELDSRGI